MNFKGIFLSSLAALPSLGLRAQSSGQNFTISPYSNFGLGEVLNCNFLQAGNNGQTYSGAYGYSFFNPATLANLRFTSFDFGMNLRSSLIESGTEKRSFNGGGMSYLSLAYPVLNKNIPRYYDSAGTRKRKGSLHLGWNSHIGLLPITSIGYNYYAEDSFPVFSRTLHSGRGGINSLQFGNSLSIGKHFSFGYSIGYVFGQMEDRSVFSVPDSADYYFVQDEKSVSVAGIQQQFGALYQFEIDSTYHRIGASYRMYGAVKGSQARLTQVIGYTTSSVEVDTLIDQNGTRTAFQIPGGFGFGYSFQWRKKWSLGLDYYRQLWGGYSAFFQPGQKLADRTDYGFTFDLNPVDEKIPGAKRMAIPVRLGYRYSSTQNVFTSNGVSTTILEQSAFVGFGIPLVRKYYDGKVVRSMVNFRLDYTTRGTTNNGLVKEQYLIGTVSFNLGDIWFQRRYAD